MKRGKSMAGLAVTAAGQAQSVERLTAEREVAGLIPGADHVEMAVPSPVGDVKIVSPISIFVLNTLTLKKSVFPPPPPPHPGVFIEILRYSKTAICIPSIFLCVV